MLQATINRNSLVIFNMSEKNLAIKHFCASDCNKKKKSRFERFKLFHKIYMQVKNLIPFYIFVKKHVSSPSLT